MMPNHSDDDPRWATLRAEHQARHGAAIAYIKRQVGPGTEFANEVAQAVLSEAGAYYQLTELPEEFVGALGADVAHRLIPEAEARDLMARLGALVRAVAAGDVPARALSLYVLYPGGSLRARRAMFVFDYDQDAPAPFAHGVLRPYAVPASSSCACTWMTPRSLTASRCAARSSSSPLATPTAASASSPPSPAPWTPATSTCRRQRQVPPDELMATRASSSATSGWRPEGASPSCRRAVTRGSR